MASSPAPVQPYRYMAVFVAAMIGVYLLIFLTGDKMAKPKLGIDLHESLQVGERVYTTSGLQATIAAIGEDTFDLEIAPGVVTRWMKMAIRDRVAAQTDDAVDEGAFGAIDEASPANPLRIETDADRLAKD